ncbi:hypothetical protein [Prosthecobacter sp.]|uniref:hypothetical protein n=1 Tax=Prosthecobacter sp. TaxID=1965333 RepID=UPI003784B19B
MRWLLLLGLTTCCMARPLPLIPLGTTPKEVAISPELSSLGYFTTWESFVIAEVMKVTSQAHQSASEIRLEEGCTLRLEAMYGTSAELAGATTLRIGGSYLHDTYQQVEPDWGVCGSLKQGQKVVVLLHRWGEDQSLTVGYHSVIVLTDKIRTLPEILRRTGSDPSRLTAADFAVLHAASPLYLEEANVIAEVMASLKIRESAFLNWLVGMCVPLVLGVILCVDCSRRLRTPLPGTYAVTSGRQD